MDRPPRPNPEWQAGSSPDPATSSAPYVVYNVGSDEPTELMDFISLIEQETGRTAAKNLLPMQTGDVLATYADIQDLTRDTGYLPKTSIKEGVSKFVAWYRDFYNV
jgi:UDP-glucuronate 4-epimerase